MLQGKRDVDTVLTMGIMEDVSIIPQPAGGKMIPSFHSLFFSACECALYILHTLLCACLYA